MNETRSFLSTAIASALDFEIMSPDDVIEHITMEILAHHLPVNLKSRLLAAALGADAMNAMLVLDTLGVDALAEHAPAHLLWKCVSDAATRSLGKPLPEADVAVAPLGPSPVVSEMPLAPAADASSTVGTKRKPNRSASASAARVRAGATSRTSLSSSSLASTPEPDGEESAFDVDTRVGGDPDAGSLDGLDDGTFDPDEVTAHGQKS